MKTKNIGAHTRVFSLLAAPVHALWVVKTSQMNFLIVLRDVASARRRAFCLFCFLYLRRSIPAAGLMRGIKIRNTLAWAQTFSPLIPCCCFAWWCCTLLSGYVVFDAVCVRRAGVWDERGGARVRDARVSSFGAKLFPSCLRALTIFHDKIKCREFLLSFWPHLLSAHSCSDAKSVGIWTRKFCKN